MSFARVGMFHFQPGTTDEVIREIQENACDYLRSLPGFISYVAIEGEGARGASVSVWHSREAADDATKRMDEWIRHTASHAVLISSDVFVGEVTIEEESEEAPMYGRGEDVIPEARH